MDIMVGQNLRKEGIRLLTEMGITLIRATVGTTGSHACGDDVRPRSLEAIVEEARIHTL